MTTTDPNAPDAALLWAQSTRDTHHSEHRTRERAEAHRAGQAHERRAGQAHERRADAGLLAALEALVTAVTYADPPKLFNGVLGHEARVPVEFVNEARAAITAAKGHDNEG